MSQVFSHFSGNCIIVSTKFAADSIRVKCTITSQTYRELIRLETLSFVTFANFSLALGESFGRTPKSSRSPIPKIKGVKSHTCT